MKTGPRCVLGVDAGNSKTVAVVADVGGRVLGLGRAGNGDIYGAGTEQAAVAAVTEAVDAALIMAFGNPDPVRVQHAAFCLAGLDWGADFAFWDVQLDARYAGLSRSLHNDGFALLRAGAPDGFGVGLSVGTGGAVVARGPEQEWSASFWIRDALGGVALGAAAFDAVVRAELEIAPATRLSDIVLDHLGYADVESMLEAATCRGARPPVYAALARDVLDAAAAGDEVAVAIVADQGRTLAAYAVAAVARVGLGSDPGCTVVLGGSVLSSDKSALRDATVQSVHAVLPAARLELCRVPPVLGAVGEAVTELEGPRGLAALEVLYGHHLPHEFLLT